ncbi:MAG: CAP domain-containing protein [Patescibacteria group bacterium]
MGKIKFISLTFVLLALGMLAYAFFPFIKPYVEKLTNQKKSDVQEIMNEAKISAPFEQSEFEKTLSYGSLDCNNFQGNVFAGDMFNKINSDRVANGDKALEWNSKLCESAELKAQDMDNNNYFEHISPAGVTPWYWIKKEGYNYTFVGENLALNYFTSQNAHTALMNSPGHRANILNDNFTEIGINYVRGKLNGQDAFFVVQHFASPAPEKPEIKYVCETDKASKQLSDLKDTKKKIEKYLSKAEGIKKDLKNAGQSTKEVDEYISDMEKKEKEVDGYIKEIQDYLKKCKG